MRAANGKKETKESLGNLASPEQHGGIENRSFAKDGSETTSRRKAVKFYSHEEARDFVKKKGIQLRDPIQYVALWDFSDEN